MPGRVSPTMAIRPENNTVVTRGVEHCVSTPIRRTWMSMMPGTVHGWLMVGRVGVSHKQHLVLERKKHDA